MELFLRVVNESFNLAKKKPYWIGFALLLQIAVVLFGIAVNFYLNSNIFAWGAFLLANVLISGVLAFLWPRIKKEHELRRLKFQEVFLENSKTFKEIWSKAFVISMIFSSVLLISRLLVWNWPHTIFFSSLISSFFLGFLLFSVVYDLNISASFKGSVDLWIRKTQFPVFVSFALMLGNSLSLITAKTLYTSLQVGGFSEVFAFAKIWSLALVLLLMLLFLTLWFNCLIVIGFMEIIKPSKGLYKQTAIESTMEPKPVE